MSRVEVIRVEEKKLHARALSALVGAVDEALAKDPSALILDLSRVEYLDSLGLAVLAMTKRKAGRRRVALAGLCPFVAKVVRAAHLADHFDILPTSEAAQEVLSA